MINSRHGWMHHAYDEVPAQVNLDFRNRRLEVTDHSHAIYDNHVSNATFDSKTQQVDTSQYRQRGYRVGSLMTGPDDPDNYYLQPGHPLSPKADKGGRFKDLKGMHYGTLYGDIDEGKGKDRMNKVRAAVAAAKAKAAAEVLSESTAVAAAKAKTAAEVL